MLRTRKLFLAAVLAILSPFATLPSIAQEALGTQLALCIGDSTERCLSAAIVVPTTSVVRGWMSPEVGTAWESGYKGAGVTITVIDDFKSSSRFKGDLGTGVLLQLHGEWTRMEASMIAPLATIKSKDFSTSTAVTFYTGLDVLNLSYGMYATSGYSVSQIRWSNQEKSIINAAGNGTAVIAKAAGNDAVAVNGTAGGKQDYLNLALIGKQSAIFVGALNSNGTELSKATLAWYSNYAGTDTSVQSHFLVVGVEGDKTGLYGTSFAAPIVSGYAAILGSKFKTATPTQITNQLLNTARTDTLLNYSISTYGKGEASLTRALAPASIQ